MKKAIASIALVLALVSPISASAATLTHEQVSAIIGVLSAFGVDQKTVLAVQAILEPPLIINLASSTMSDVQSNTPVPSSPAPQPTVQPAPAAAAAPQPQARLEIVRPSPRTYVANNYTTNPDGTLRSGLVVIS